MCTKLKAILMAIILAGFASQQAAAENFSEEEMAFAFGDSTIDESAEMVLLSNEEMMATEGELGPAAPIYLAYYYYGPTIGAYAAMGIGLYSRFNMGNAFKGAKGYYNRLTSR